MQSPCIRAWASFCYFSLKRNRSPPQLAVCFCSFGNGNRSASSNLKAILKNTPLGPKSVEEREHACTGLLVYMPLGLACTVQNPWQALALRQRTSSNHEKFACDWWHPRIRWTKWCHCQSWNLANNYKHLIANEAIMLRFSMQNRIRSLATLRGGAKTNGDQTWQWKIPDWYTIPH